MSRTFPGDPATYIEFEGPVVADGVTGALLRSLPGGQVSVNGVLVSYREPTSGALATTVQTNAFAQLPDLLVPMPEGVTLRTAVVTVDWPDDGVSAQRLRPTQEEYFDEVDQITAALAAAASDARLAAEDAASAASRAASGAADTAAAALVASMLERVPQNANGTWSPKQSAVPRVFVRTAAGTSRPSSATIVGSTLRPGDRVEHEVDLP